MKTHLCNLFEVVPDTLINREYVFHHLVARYHKQLPVDIISVIDNNAPYGMFRINPNLPDNSSLEIQLSGFYLEEIINLRRQFDGDIYKPAPSNICASLPLLNESNSYGYQTPTNCTYKNNS